MCKVNENTVLLVDDEPDALEFLRDLLEDNDFSVVSASSAEAGFTTAKKHHPDLICLDVLMPERSGMSLYQKLRSDPDLRHVPVLIMSGLSLSRDLAQVEYRRLDDGTVIPEPDGFIEKPVNVARFLALVAEVIR